MSIVEIVTVCLTIENSDLPRRQMGRLKGRERALKKCPKVVSPSRQNSALLGISTADVNGSDVMMKFLEMVALKAERRVEQSRS